MAGIERQASEYLVRQALGSHGEAKAHDQVLR